jgi:hypothetical protein
MISWKGSNMLALRQKNKRLMGMHTCDQMKKHQARHQYSKRAGQRAIWKHYPNTS